MMGQGTRDLFPLTCELCMFVLTLLFFPLLISLNLCLSLPILLILPPMNYGIAIYAEIYVGSSNCLVRENGNPRTEIDSFMAKTAVVKYLSPLF